MQRNNSKSMLQPLALEAGKTKCRLSPFLWFHHANGLLTFLSLLSTTLFSNGLHMALLHEPQDSEFRSDMTW